MIEHSPLATARHLSQLLLAAADLSREVFAEIAEHIGVPVHLARALCLLQDAAPMNELATKLACDKSYITPLADDMESLDLVKRVPGKDRRTKLLALTPKGVAVRDALETQIALRSPVMERLNDVDRATLESILTKLIPSSSPPNPPLSAAAIRG